MTGETDIAAQVETAKAEAEAKAKRRSAGESGKPRRARKRPFPFKVENGQTWRQVETESDDGGSKKTKWTAFASELHVLALTRSADGEDWGRLLRVIDRDGQAHEWAMPAAMLAGSGEALRAELLRLGLEFLPLRKSKEWLMEYLISADPEGRARCVDKIGWHGDSFVLPDETIGAGDASETVILQSAERLDHALRVSGALEDWRSEIAAPALGNSRLVLAISAAFAAPLLEVTQDEGGGFHLRGGSSMGKSTALFVAGSVWGGGGAGGYVRTWRATDNALEALAALHNSALLALDELGQVEPRAAGAAAYMLANGKGKARAGKEGQARRGYEWRLIFLSTGEIGLADKIKEGGGQIAAGMEVRVIDLRADAGKGFGIFESVTDKIEAEALSKRLKSASGKVYGSAGRAFLRGIVDDLAEARTVIENLRNQFIRVALKPGADGQVRRVADRFALVAAAGELATAYGVTGWPAGAALEAAQRCFADWLTERGGTGSSEVAEARRRLAEAVQLYGQARFQDWESRDRAVITPRWGFVKSEVDQSAPSEGDMPAKRYRFFFLPAAMSDLLKGLDQKAVIGELMDAAVIVAHVQKDGKRVPSHTHRVPNAGGVQRLYEIDPAALGGGGDD